MSEFSKLSSVPTEEWDSSLAPLMDDLQGRPLNVHCLLASHPQLLQAWWPFRNYYVTGGSLGRRNAEIVILRTAVHVRSWYEWASHVERGLEVGLSLVDIERIIDGPNAPGWAPKDAALLTAVDELESDGALSAGTINALGQHFDQKQILDLIAIRGTYMMLASFLKSAEIELDEHVQEVLPKSVSARHFRARLGSQPS